MELYAVIRRAARYLAMAATRSLMLWNLQSHSAVRRGRKPTCTPTAGLSFSPDEAAGGRDQLAGKSDHEGWQVTSKEREQPCLRRDLRSDGRMLAVGTLTVHGSSV